MSEANVDLSAHTVEIDGVVYELRGGPESFRVHVRGREVGTIDLMGEQRFVGAMSGRATPHELADVASAWVNATRSR